MTPHWPKNEPQYMRQRDNPQRRRFCRSPYRQDTASELGRADYRAGSAAISAKSHEVRKKMNTHKPFVSVVTPVYNGEAFLADCIESVLNQNYQNYEYIIVNNRSTDGTLEIAEKFARQDKRIRVHNNERFVPVIENHNIAFRLISPAAKYCKVISADDLLFPECIAELVECAEANPAAGIIGSYQLSGASIRWQGFKYPQTLFHGRELCRRIFLAGDRDFGFGTPTSILYRADLVRANPEFYPNPSPHSDTSACFHVLRECDFGFVYQVLSFEKTHPATQSYRSAQMNRYSSAYLNDLKEYGPFYLSHEELDRKKKEVLEDYYRYLAINWLVGFKDKEFWQYHKARLQELGYPLSRTSLIRAAGAAALHEIRSPAQAIKKLWGRAFPKSSRAGIPPARTA